MQKFDHVLLASDFDNTLVYTQSALDNGTDIPPMCPRNREALDYFIQNGGLFAISTGRALPAFMDYAKDVADERAVRHRQTARRSTTSAPMNTSTPRFSARRSTTTWLRCSRGSRRSPSRSTMTTAASTR